MRKLILTLILSLSLVFFSLYQSITAKAATVIFQDDFSTDLNKWEAVRGNISSWTIVNGKAGATVNLVGNTVELVPKDEYWDDGYEHIQIEFDMYPIQGVDKNFTMRYLTPFNFYELHDSLGTVYLERVNPSAFSTFASPLLNGNGPYHFDIRYLVNNIKIYINDVLHADIDDFDNPYNSGKIGMKVGTGSTTAEVYFDNIVVTSIDPSPTPTPFPYYSQRDPQWKDDIYDQANLWAPLAASFERWGCAVTAASMILNYHGITELPTGVSSTPGNLNSWLKTQSDGFLGNGLVNWQAIARATRLAQLTHPLWPALEHTVGSSNMSALETELTSNRPAILKQPGHYIAAYQFNSPTDIDIKDPYDPAKVKLSAFGNTFLSMRTFTPSFTNLGYILFTSETDVHTQLQQKEGNTFQQVANATITDETPLTDDLGEVTPFLPSLRLLEYAKPPEDDYRIRLTKSQPGIEKYTLYTYDKDGNLTQTTESLLLGNSPQYIEINYSVSSSSAVTRRVGYETIRQDILNSRAAGLVRKNYNTNDLLAALSQSEKLYRKNKPLSKKAFEAFEGLLKARSSIFISPDAYDIIRSDTQLTKLQLF